VPEANDGLCETMTLVIFFYIKLLTGCVNTAVFFKGFWFCFPGCLEAIDSLKRFAF
jgi:hypothetical protein